MCVDVCTGPARDKNIIPVLRDAEPQVQGLEGTLLSQQREAWFQISCGRQGESTQVCVLMCRLGCDLTWCPAHLASSLLAGSPWGLTMRSRQDVAPTPGGYPGVRAVVVQRTSIIGQTSPRCPCLHVGPCPRVESIAL
jgi:hypothetical protein